jgi:hypothetical protein
VPRGKCKLCLEEKDLVDGHLISAGIVRQLRAPMLSNPNPLTLTKKIAVQTSVPISDYVMCQECDNRLGQYGETWTIPNLATMESFPIGEALHNATPLITIGRLAAYAGRDISGIDMESLGFFGLSVFWKCASHPWRDATNGRIDIDLGPYQEPLRQYLHGDASFPTDIALLIAVPTDEVMIGAYTPRRGHERTFHNFVCYVPGVEFTLCVGKGIPKEVRTCCSYSSPNKLIYLSAAAAENTKDSFGLLRQSARPSKGVKRMLEEIMALKAMGGKT